MPREAVLLSAVDQVLPLVEIAPALLRLVSKDHGGKL
jgi:chemotaxis response regulator CheB